MMKIVTMQVLNMPFPSHLLKKLMAPFPPTILELLSLDNATADYIAGKSSRLKTSLTALTTAM